MAFADPQTITINAAAQTLNRVKDDGFASVYQTDDGNHKLTISHQESKGRVRRMCRLDKKVVAADPLNAVNTYQTAGVYIVIDQPLYGFTSSDIDYLVQGFKTWLSSANVQKIVGNQH